MRKFLRKKTLNKPCDYQQNCCVFVCVCFSLNDWFFFFTAEIQKKNKNNNRLSINTWWMDWLIDWFNEWIIWTFFFRCCCSISFQFSIDYSWNLKRAHTHTHHHHSDTLKLFAQKKNRSIVLFLWNISEIFLAKKKSSHMMMMMMMKNKYSKMEIENEKKKLCQQLLVMNGEE